MTKALIKRRRLQLLVHSCIYYHFNTNLINDETFDSWARELVQLQKDHPEESKQVEWYSAFKDWEGSTGAYLPYTNGWVIFKAQQLIRIGGQGNEAKRIQHSKIEFSAGKKDSQGNRKLGGSKQRGRRLF